MNDANAGGTPADPTTDEELDILWDNLQDSLAAYLGTMVDPEERDHLILELANPSPGTGGGCAPYAQFAAFGDGTMIRAEISGDAYLLPQYRLGEDGTAHLKSLGWSGNDDAEKNWYIESPVTDAHEVGFAVVWALRACFGIAHPQLLTHHAWGPAAQGVGVLGLCATADVPTDEPQAPATPTSRGTFQGQLAVQPAGRDDLVRIVADVLREKYETEPTVDDDGDFVLHHLDQPVWVRVRAEQPAVEILARVAHDVRSRRATAVEIGLLNRDSAWVGWTLHGRSVWQTILLPGSPFVPSHLDGMLDVFLQAMTATRDDLAYRLNGRVA